MKAPEIKATSELVGAWSDFRLPFEPRGAARRFREELRLALRGLPRKPVLHAVYTSTKKSQCDVENIAIYNVGYAALRGLGRRQVIVERRLASGPISPSGAAFSHVLEYHALSSPISWSTWRSRKTLAEWRGAPIPRLSSSTTASTVWESLKRGMAGTLENWDHAEPLGVVACVEAGPDVDLVTVVKVLLDAIVAAGHVYVGPDLDEAVARLAAAQHTDPGVIRTWLTDAGVLGPRRLIHLRAGGIQWNPADDLVVAIAVTRVEQTGSAPSVSAEIHTVEVAAACGEA